MDDEQILIGIAEARGIALFRSYGEAEAAAFVGWDVSTMKRKRRAGELDDFYTDEGERKIRYLGIRIAKLIRDGIGKRQKNKPAPNHGANPDEDGPWQNPSETSK